MKILGYNYEVIIKEGSSYIDAFGKLNAKELQIQIAADLVPAQITSTLLHEIIEALNYHLQLELPHRTIMSLESGLYQTLTDNGVDLSVLREGEA